MMLVSFQIFIVERRGIILYDCLLLLYGCGLETAGANVENILDQRMNDEMTSAWSSELSGLNLRL
jgi:hypothetical protein